MPVVLTDKPLKPRPTFDFYETPYKLARRVFGSARFGTLFGARILDPGAGTGVWGKAVRDAVASYAPMRGTHKPPHITGVEIEPVARPEGYDDWHYGDFLTFPVPTHEKELYDYVVGNPPYKFAEEFVRHGMKMLKPYGSLAYLLRLDFLASRKRLRLWEDWPLYCVQVCATRPSFTGNGKANAMEYGIFTWFKLDKSMGVPPAKIEFWDWND